MIKSFKIIIILTFLLFSVAACTGGGSASSISGIPKSERLN
jgi:hypothetical protein